MEFIGLLFEILFLCAGVYLYLYSIGKVSTTDPDKKQQSEEFRTKNKWLKPLSLVLIAFMVVEIVLHLMSFFK